MQGTIVIDGYNLIRRGFTHVPTRGGLEAHRAALESRLAEFLRARPEARIVLIYDGAPESGGGLSRRRRRGDRLEVIFSEPPQSADDLVLQESKRLRRGGPVLVVTSDRKDIVKNLPGGDRVRHLSSEDFALLLDEMLEERSRAGPVRTGRENREDAAGLKPETVTEDEVREWLAVFGEDETAIRRPRSTARPESEAGNSGGDRGPLEGDGSRSESEPGEEDLPGATSEEIARWLEGFCDRPVREDDG